MLHTFETCHICVTSLFKFSSSILLWKTELERNHLSNEQFLCKSALMRKQHSHILYFQLVIWNTVAARYAKLGHATESTTEEVFLFQYFTTNTSSTDKMQTIIKEKWHQYHLDLFNIRKCQ